MSTVNTLVYNIQGFAGSAEQSSKKAQKKLQRAADAVNHTNEKKVDFADEKGKSLDLLSGRLRKNEKPGIKRIKIVI